MSQNHSPKPAPQPAPENLNAMNLFGCWTAVVLAVLTTVASILGGVLPQKTFHHHQHHLLQQQPQQQQDQFPSAHQTHHVGIDMERWSNAVDASNFPLQDTDSDGASTDNDRSVYDPGVVGKCVFDVLCLK